MSGRPVRRRFLAVAVASGLPLSRYAMAGKGRPRAEGIFAAATVNLAKLPPDKHPASETEHGEHSRTTTNNRCSYRWARTSTAVCRICFISSCSSSGTAKRVLYGGIICFRSAGGHEHDPGTRQRQLDFYSSAAGQAAGDDPPPKQRSCGRAFS